MIVTFLRVRPVENISQIGAATRRREGTTALEMVNLGADDVERAIAAYLLPISVGMSEVEPAAWVVTPTEALELIDRQIPGWRMTVTDDGPADMVLEAVARTRAAFLRTGRSQAEVARQRLDLPGLSTKISVYADDVPQAVAAVDAGAEDLLLRDWDAERLGELRRALGDRLLVERSAFALGVEVDQVRSGVPAGVFTAWLNQVDGSGGARPRTEWAPGKDQRPPMPERRISAAWQDAIWVTGEAPPGLGGSGDLRPILESSLEGHAPSRHQVEALFGARGEQVDAVAWTADQLRRRTNGDTVTYVINRNINYTNLCYFRCGFCAFSKGPRSLNLRGEPYLMSVGDIVEATREAWERGATEVTLQGGIHPDFTGAFYLQVVEAIKAAVPAMHIHGFTPLEVWQGAETLGIPVKEFLEDLRDSGLGSLPGTAAEILDDEVRIHLCPDKIRTAQWAEVMITAHELGLPATSTIMFGHIDHPRSWANHLEVIRQIQRRTGGFTELVPLPFVHMGSPIYLRGRARPGPTWDEVVLVHAVGRIALDGLVPNIQASWVKLGLDGGARLLDAGCNDLGGTLMGEIITRSAGASHGQEVTPAQFEAVISSAGRVSARRTTTYEVVAGSYRKG